MLTYPLNLDTTKYSHVVLYERDAQTKELMNTYAFYTPLDYMVGDSASWSDVELNMYKGFIDNVASKVGNNDFSSMGEAAKSAFADFSKSKDAGLVLAQTLGNGTPVGDIAAGIMRAKGVAVNPHNVLVYKGNSIRQFNLQIRMIPSSTEESDRISEIINRLREGSYGSKNGDFLLNYPSHFKMVYMSPGSKVNKHMPATATLALGSVNASYNPTSNLYHSDGAPTEITLSLMFREIKSLTRNDIQTLRNNQNSASQESDDTWLI